MPSDLPLRPTGASQAQSESESWLTTVRRLYGERRKKFHFYSSLMAATFVIPIQAIQMMNSYHLLETVSVFVTLGCLIPGFVIFFRQLAPYCLNKDPNEQIVAIVTDVVVRRNPEAIPCWAEAYPTLNARVLRTLRVDVADMLLYQPLPTLDSEDKLFCALRTEILYTWNQPEQTVYTLKLIQLLYENAGSKHIGNLERLVKRDPENEHQGRIQQALIAVLPIWKARD
jgi:hypothetical protein